MSERIKLPIFQEVHPTIHNFSDKELNQHLKDYDLVRNMSVGLILTGIGLIGNADKLPATVAAYIDGVVVLASGYWLMEKTKRNAKEAVLEARARGLKVVKKLFGRKLELQDKVA